MKLQGSRMEMHKVQTLRKLSHGIILFPSALFFTRDLIQLYQVPSALSHHLIFPPRFHANQISISLKAAENRHSRKIVSIGGRLFSWISLIQTVFRSLSELQVTTRQLPQPEAEPKFPLTKKTSTATYLP
jgi:hypothetical protein